MNYKSQALINPHGRKVRVAGQRVEGLLEQGFKRVPENEDADGAEAGSGGTGEDEGAEGDHAELSKSDLWAEVKERELDDGVDWSTSSREDLIAILEDADGAE